MLGEGTGAAASLTSYPDACHGTGLVSSSAPAPAASAVPAPSSAAPAPSSTVAVPAATPAPGRMLEEYRGAISVTVYSDAFPGSRGSGDEPSSSVPEPASVAEQNSRGAAVSVTAAYPDEVLQGGGGDMPSSSVWTASSAEAAPASSLFQNDGTVSVTAYPEAFHDSGYNWSATPAPSSTVAVPSAAPATNRMLEENNAAVSLTAYPEVFHSRGDNPSSAALAVLSPAPIPLAVLTPALPPGPMLEGSGDIPSSSVPAPSLFENNDSAVSITAYHEVLDDSRYNWSAAPTPSSMVAVPAPAPATSRMLEDSNGTDSVTAYPEVFHSSGDNSSSVPAHSSAVAVLSPAPTPLAVLTPALAPGLLLEDNVNNGAVPVASFTVAGPSAAPATSRMLEENNGAVYVTAYPEVFHSRGDNSSSAPAPSSAVAVPSAATAPSSTVTPALAPGLMPECYMNNGVHVGTYLQAGHGREKKKPSSPPSAAASGRTLDDCAKEWAARKAASGAPLHHCELPFLTGAPNAVECHACYRVVHPSEEIKCSVSRCEQPFHLTCVVEDTANFTAESFKCPQHGCVVCKQKTFFWRCGRCTVAAHTKCAPWPVIHLKDDQGSAICWRHPSNWLLQNENADLTNNIEEAFCRLPLPYVSEEFNIDSTIRDFSAVVCKPPPYTHIRRNVYLVKKKRADSSADTGCRNCRADSVCRDDCECRGLSMSCSKNCRCSDLCSNKPFRKDKKFKIVKSEGCGWGAVALEPLEKGDFIIEYVGEVINDATCEQRLWEMKRRGDKNFYMCEISKDCTIDATFKGNTSRFLNHSCDPNCKLEKWQVEGEIRVGVFASRNIEVGEPLTYDYRFVHFGEKVKCNCGAKSCHGYLGIQLKNPTQDALAAAAALENQGDCSPSRLKPETHLLPWTNCIEVPFNLRSKTKIDRLCWGRKRQRTSIIDPSPSSPMEATGPVPNGCSAELV